MTPDEYKAWRQRVWDNPAPRRRGIDTDVLAEIIALLPSWLFIAGLVAIVVAVL